MAMFLQAGSPQSTWVRIMMTFTNGANSEISIRTLLNLNLWVWGPGNLYFERFLGGPPWWSSG